MRLYHGKNIRAFMGLVALASARLAPGQEVINGGFTTLGTLRSNGSSSTVDFTGSGSTSPVKSGTLAARPASCSVGQMYFITDATPGQNLSLCTSAGVWSTIAGSIATGGVNAQSGTSYSVVDSDKEKLITFSNNSAVAVTLPQAGASSWFVSGWDCYLENRGAGTVTIIPTASTIDGATSLALASNSGVRIVSDGTNYYTERGMGGSGGSGGAVSSVAGKTGTVTLVSADLSDITVPSITPSGNAAVNAPLAKCLDKTVSYSTDLSQAAQVYSVVLGTFPAHWVFTDAWARETTTFASPAITTLTASIGPSGSETSVLPTVSLKQTANVVSAFSSNYAASDSATPIVAQFVVTGGGGNLNTLTAGTWDVRVCGHAGR
jgi:hypothetical protein